jgi:hypothetical protein
MKKKDEIEDFVSLFGDLDGAVRARVRARLAADALVVLLYHDFSTLGVGIAFLGADIAACGIAIAFFHVYSDFVGHFGSLV